jgi:hypothetical protein
MTSPLETIKKLLRMQNGGTPAEIETALRKARDLADRHNIDLASVNTSDDSHLNLITHKYFPLPWSLSYDHGYARTLIKTYFNVEPILVQDFDVRDLQPRKRLCLVGTEVDIEIAEYVHDFLVGHFRRSWAHRPSRRIRNRKSYVYGIFVGISSKLNSDQPAISTSLALSRDAYVEKIFKNITTTKSKLRPARLSDIASNAGYHIGRNTSIHPAVKAANRPDRPALQEPLLALPGF